MPTKYRFVTNGDFVDFYDDSMLVTTLPSDYSGISWRYDSSPGITFTFNGHEYHTDTVGDISVNDTPISSQGAFKTALSTIFSHYAAASEGSNIYTEDGELTDNRLVDLNGKTLKVRHNGQDFISIDPTLNNESAEIRAYNVTGDGNKARATAQTQIAYATSFIEAGFNDGSEARLRVTADATGRLMEFTADKYLYEGLQEFADNAAAITGGLEVGMFYHTAGALKIVISEE